MTEHVIIAHVFTPGGIRVSVPFADGATASDVDAAIAQRGFTATMPGSGFASDTKFDTITHVIRGQHHNDDDRPPTDKVYFYADNEALQFKSGHLYLNTPADIAEFEAQSGLKLASLKIYDAPQAPGRKDAERFWAACKTPFELAKTPNGRANANGYPLYNYAYRVQKTKQQPEQPQQPQRPAHWAETEDGQNALKAALNEHGMPDGRATDVLFQLDPLAKRYGDLNMTLKDVLAKIPAIAEQIKSTEKVMLETPFGKASE